MYRMLGLKFQCMNSALADLSSGVDSNFSTSLLHKRVIASSLKVVGRMSSFKDGPAFNTG